jgi:hypothetical protein
MSFTPMPKDTEIHLCAKVPLDPAYTGTIYQVDKASQKAMFANYSVRTYTQYSYQRFKRGVIRVADMADSLYGINYMYFDNLLPSVGTRKTFYCFVTEVEYVNDHTTNVYYELDVMQTYYFDYRIPACFVEREHTPTDNLFEHLIPENIPVPEYVVQAMVQKIYHKPTADSSGGVGTMRFLYVPNEKRILYVNTDSEGKITNVEVDPVTDYTQSISVDGQVMGCSKYDLGVTSTAHLSDNVSAIVTKLVEISANIVSIYFIPQDAVDYYYQGNQIIEGNVFRDDHSSDTYTPHNKKLLSYPYRCLVLSNNNGQTAEYHWENFSSVDGGGNPVAQFRYYNVTLPRVMVQAVPREHRRLAEDFESSVLLSDFQTCSWSEDSFQRWWNTNKDAFISSVLNTGISAIASGLMSSTYGTISGVAAEGAAIRAGYDEESTATIKRIAERHSAMRQRGTGINAANDIRNLMASYKGAKATPDSVHGQLGGQPINFRADRTGFTLYDMGIRPEIARSIDSYFSMYGYAINQVKELNIFSANAKRPRWNYVKTQNAMVLPSQSSSDLTIDAEHCNMIAEIFNRGVTFWMRRDYVGNYNANNDPV